MFRCRPTALETGGSGKLSQETDSEFPQKRVKFQAFPGTLSPGPWGQTVPVPVIPNCQIAAYFNYFRRSLPRGAGWAAPLILGLC